MPVSAKTLRLLMDAGVSLDLVVAIVSSIDEDMAGRKAPDKEQSPAAKRMQKYRARRVENGLSPYFNGNDYRPALLLRDGDRCVYCGSPDTSTVDHMLPISQGGTDHLDNLSLSCAACNGGKSGRSPDEAGMQFASGSAEMAFVRYVREHVRPEQDSEQPRTTANIVRPSRVRDNPLFEELTGKKERSETSVSDARKPKPTRRCPPSWTPNPSVIEQAEAAGFTAGEIERELANIRDHEFRSPRTDWDAVARTWFRNAEKRKPTNGFTNGHAQSAFDARHAERQDNFLRALKAPSIVPRA